MRRWPAWQGFYTPAHDTKAKGSQKAISCRTERGKIQRRKGFDIIDWESCEEKRLLTESGELLCFYLNARNLLSKMEQFEAWFVNLIRTSYE